MQVLPAALNAESSSLSGLGNLSGLAGTPLILTITPRDTFGNTWTQGPLNVQASAFLEPFKSSSLSERIAVAVAVNPTASGEIQLRMVSEEVIS